MKRVKPNDTYRKKARYTKEYVNYSVIQCCFDDLDVSKFILCHP